MGDEVDPRVVEDVAEEELDAQVDEARNEDEEDASESPNKQVEKKKKKKKSKKKKRLSGGGAPESQQPKKKQRLAALIEDEVEVEDDDGDDDEEDEEDDDEVDDEIVDNEYEDMDKGSFSINRLANMKSSSHEEVDRLEEERKKQRIDQEIDEKYGYDDDKVVEKDEDYVDEDVQNTFHPTPMDPSLFLVPCKRGEEQEILINIFNRFLVEKAANTDLYVQPLLPLPQRIHSLPKHSENLL
jgi:hypothetical protein